MSKYLVVVESPNKVKKISSFLGSDYTVTASVGHVIDLPSDELAVDIKNNFKPTYTIMDDKKDIVKNIVKLSKKAEIVYLATDEDREGEAIAGHIASQLDPGTEIKRIRFNSITKEAVLKAIQNPTDIDQHLFEAYEARRILDRLAGYKTSYPVKQATGGASAGRVQSAALRILAEREKEIINFIPVIYYPIEADLLSPKNEKVHVLIKIPKALDIHTQEEAEKIIEVFKKGPIKVSKFEKKEVNVNPTAPFTTSTLLQAAATNLGFALNSTKAISQSLYQKGFITYIRTDSVNIVPEFIKEIRNRISTDHGSKYLPASAIQYTTKQKNAQEAHEAIRPTDLTLTSPTGIDADELKLYELIWRRTVASQMNPAKVLRSSAEFSTDKYAMGANGSKELFDGFRKVWTYTDASDQYLPELKVGDDMKLVDIKTERKETSPPSHFSETSIVKELEDKDIGRPSTYASLIKTLQDRNYVEKKNKSLIVTELGLRVNDFLVSVPICFVDISFTADMENKLDEISNNKNNKLAVLTEFWGRLKADLDKAKEQKVANSITDYDCPLCKSKGIEAKLVKKFSQYGPFYSCQNYKKSDKNSCTFTAKVGPNGEPIEKAEKKAVVLSEHECPICGEKMIERTSKFGKFYGCSKYPKCKGLRDQNGTAKESKKTGKWKKNWKKKDKADE